MGRRHGRRRGRGRGRPGDPRRRLPHPHRPRPGPGDHHGAGGTADRVAAPVPPGSCGDGSVGLLDGTVDVAVAWLPVAGPGIAHRVAATEQRWVALPVGHRLAHRAVVPFAELAAEPFVALPASAGPMREFWLASEHRASPALVGAEAATADEAFEAVASGAGVAL